MDTELRAFSEQNGDFQKAISKRLSYIVQHWKEKICSRQCRPRKLSEDSSVYLLAACKSDSRIFFRWKLHGSTKFVVRAVALLSAKRSEKESSKMIVGFNKLCVLSNNTNLKKHGTNRGKERRQPHRGCLKQQHRGKPASTI